MRLLCLTLLALAAPVAPGAPLAPLAPLAPAPLAPCAPLAPVAPLSAAEIARRVEDRDTGRDSRAELRMKLFDRRGRVRDRALTILTLRGADKAQTVGDRLLIRFTYPNDIRGTGFLVWEHPKGDDERFLYLPSLGRVRRIAGTEAQESFVGSDFSYEDIGGREFDDYTYALVDENASWSAPDGSVRPAWRLESTRKDASVQYPRVVSVVLKESYVVVQAEMFNRRNEPEKAYSVAELRQVQGIWTVTQSAMTNAIEKTRTELQVAKIEYNTGLKEDAFTRRELEGSR